MFPAELSEPVVAEPAGGHLYANLVPGGVCGRVKGLHVADYAKGGGPGTDQGLVGVTFLPAKLEVAVGNGKRLALEANLFHKAHRVDASAYCNKEHLNVCA